MSDHRYIVQGRSLFLVSDGGSRARVTRAQLERSSRDIVTSRAFADKGFAGLSASSVETLHRNAQGVQLARANGL